jgi:vacuolar-type H+-ATPase subunit E/Vma4
LDEGKLEFYPFLGTWRVFLNEKWQVKRWSGALQLQQQEIVANSGALDLQSYLQNESSLQQQKTKEAEQMLALGNSALQKGDPQQARRAFQFAYGLSTHDEAFNEDARVQLNNLKLQQALMGLNVRQAAVSGANDAVGGRLNQLRNNKDANYTQQDAKQIIDNNSADENGAFMKLAERLIQQQDAAVANPAVIRANIPEQGRLLTFKRAVVVDTWADLNIGLKARTATAASWNMRLLVLAITALVLAGLGLLARSVAKTQQA